MGSKVCMNDLCGASLTDKFKKGWALRSGEFANLCDKCGLTRLFLSKDPWIETEVSMCTIRTYIHASLWQPLFLEYMIVQCSNSIAYEQLALCDLFHLDDTGWRECTSCGKCVHCGCIASSAFLYLLDNGGVSCISCTRNSGLLQNTSEEKPKEFGMSMENSVGETRSSTVDNQVNNGNFDKIMLKQSSVSTDDNGRRSLHPYENDGVTGYQMKREESFLPSGEIRTSISTFNEVTAESAHVARFHKYKENTVNKDIYGSPVQTNLTISLATPSVAGPWSRPILPKVPKPIFAQGFGPNAGTNSQVRVARPPVEGRVKNQLLPRYWPRITEQELKQISGDSKSTIVPLFEKVLSASDAGRIGRLVLPKACAEAYFPPISQPEGLPLKIQDVNGKEWVFQFRFWPNNNSRMYVLEGVTPCIQSMLLQAGDTVTFSRVEPEGKLLMGFRKASTAMKDTHLSAMHSGIFSSEPSFLGINISENLSTMSDHSGLLQSMKGSTDSHLNALSRNLNLPTIRDGSWLHMNEKHGDKGRDGSFPPSMLAPERKRSRNIGPKNKRLLFDSQDALELKHTWEELQDMLCPPTSITPSTFTIEDHEFEEYEEPPVLGKGSIFTVRSSGEQEQWAQCDNCSKWRRLPANILLPPQWTCQNNVCDPNRCSCPAPEELSPRDLENLLKLAKDFQKMRIATSHWLEGEEGCPNADAITGGNAFGENTSEPSIVATTTKHPRHRPGCSCIVCIQPPSGKGKHKPTCTCNVCMTVKRRFKTLMLRKKMRQSEREAEIAKKNQQLLWRPKEEEEVDSISRQVIQLDTPNTNDSRLCSENGKGQVDLNFHPHREEDSSHANMTGPAPARVSMMSLLQVANLPLEMYLKQNGLTSLICNEQQQQQASSGSPVRPRSEGGRLDSTPGTRPVVQEERESDDQIRSSSS